jgi:hypothetical protein
LGEDAARAVSGNALRETGRFAGAITACQDAVVFGQAGNEHNERIAPGNLDAIKP